MLSQLVDTPKPKTSETMPLNERPIPPVLLDFEEKTVIHRSRAVPQKKVYLFSIAMNSSIQFDTIIEYCILLEILMVISVSLYPQEQVCSTRQLRYTGNERYQM